ncbi:MAG: hotdog domain-containing protein, partial [Planctomycetia bacterium]
PRRPMVSVAMNAVEFHKPVLVGDEVSFYATVSRVGRTSLTIHIDVEVTRDGQPMKMTEADMTFVAVELDGDTRRAVPLCPEE